MFPGSWEELVLQVGLVENGQLCQNLLLLFGRVPCDVEGVSWSSTNFQDVEAVQCVHDTWLGIQKSSLRYLETFQQIGQQNDIKKAHRCRALLLISVPKLAIAGRRLAGYDSIVTSHCPALD